MKVVYVICSHSDECKNSECSHWSKHIKNTDCNEDDGYCDILNTSTSCEIVEIETNNIKNKGESKWQH